MQRAREMLNLLDDIEDRIYNYGVKKRNEYVKERKITNGLKIEAKKLETAAYYENLGKELKIKAIARAEARAKSKANYPSKSSQIARVAEEVSQLVHTDPDPFNLFGKRNQNQSVVRSDYFDNLP